MLVLSRKSGEAIIVAGEIRFEILSIRGDKVRVGITAPADIPVHREEVAKAIELYGSTKGATGE